MSDRFEFGKNWSRFLKVLNDDRISIAGTSLQKMLGVVTLEGFSFLDIGSGSGLFSLCARRMGARVHSIDYDVNSVKCTNELKNRYYKNDDDWQIEQGDVLDSQYMDSLGVFDVVYSWGVLHHTGSMMKALEIVGTKVANGGILYIAIYNRQQYWSTFYKLMKFTYVRAPFFIKWLIAGSYISFQIAKGLVKDALFFRNPLNRYIDKMNDRGMAVFYDWLDWVGGYPFEVASPEEIFDFYHERNFELLRMRTMGGGLGCNEFMFKKNDGKLGKGQL